MAWNYEDPYCRRLQRYCYGVQVQLRRHCMCMYDILNVNDEGSLRSLIKSHGRIIVDYPYMVYAAGGEANVN